MTNNNQLLTADEVAQHCMTLAKYVALWHDRNDHYRNKVAICISFARAVEKYREVGAGETWRTLVTDDTAYQPESFAQMNMFDLHFVSCYMSMLYEEVLVDREEPWIDGVTEEEWDDADELIAKANNTFDGGRK